MNATTLRRALLTGVLLACGCSGSDAARVAPAADTDAGAADVASPPPAPDAGRRRGFRMGFTPFPFDATAEAQAKVYEHLANDADLYAFHMTAGVPWKAAAEKKPLAQWGSAIRGTFATQKAVVQKGHAIYLGLTPLDDSRTRLADEWADAEQVPLTPPWDGYALDAPEVKAAYLHFCEEAIAHYAPDFLARGASAGTFGRSAPGPPPIRPRAQPRRRERQRPPGRRLGDAASSRSVAHHAVAMRCFHSPVCPSVSAPQRPLVPRRSSRSNCFTVGLTAEHARMQCEGPEGNVASSTDAVASAFRSVLPPNSRPVHASKETSSSVPSASSPVQTSGSSRPGRTHVTGTLLGVISL